jgi:hypothetical protein
MSADVGRVGAWAQPSALGRGIPEADISLLDAHRLDERNQPSVNSDLK